MEGFSDGMYGFAAALLTLGLVVKPPGIALQQALNARPGHLAYAVSFLATGVSWLLHTSLAGQLAGVNQLSPRLNLPALLVAAFPPFPAGLIAGAARKHHASSERAHVTWYGLTLLAICLLGPAPDAYARHGHLCRPAQEGEELHSTQRKFPPAVSPDT